MLFAHRFLAKVRGRNIASTPTQIILEQLNEPRPLPMGRKEFEEWSDRIIGGALVPGATANSQKYILANSILHLGPTEDHKPDAFFVHSLRKYAANQVADVIRREIFDADKRRLADEEAAAKVAAEPKSADVPAS